jgi:hypothetical protein
MLDDYDTSLHDPRDDPGDSGYRPQTCDDEEDEEDENDEDEQDELEDVLRDDIYAFMLSVDQKTSELNN